MSVNHIAAATAIGAVGFLTCPALAQAAPPFPLAPACSQYGFSDPFTVTQSNGWTVYVNQTGKVDKTIQGRAVTSDSNGKNLKGGNISGANINGRDIVFAIDWDDTGRGNYSGRVEDDGFARGLSSGAEPSASPWQSLRQMPCLTQSAPQQPPASPTATVTGDVDVYDVPGGNGNVIGMLTAGSQVGFAGCKADNWCHVTGNGVPNGDGWVWGDFLKKP
jgi:hypothetical protein